MSECGRSDIDKELTGTDKTQYGAEQDEQDVADHITGKPAVLKQLEIEIDIYNDPKYFSFRNATIIFNANETNVNEATTFSKNETKSYVAKYKY